MNAMIAASLIAILLLLPILYARRLVSRSQDHQLEAIRLEMDKSRRLIESLRENLSMAQEARPGTSDEPQAVVNKLDEILAPKLNEWAFVLQKVDSVVSGASHFENTDDPLEECIRMLDRLRLMKVAIAREGVQGIEVKKMAREWLPSSEYRGISVEEMRDRDWLRAKYQLN